MRLSLFLIAEKLNLPNFENTIYIEEVATDKEIEKARYLRKNLGKHVIPVPTVEIKSQFSGYFLNNLGIRYFFAISFLSKLV